ncbi:MAG TPA: ABC transporter ATP-binding protein [Methanoregula sp.]|nr:ABC transporter ATP-binding protein [Methanoregula sp.]
MIDLAGITKTFGKTDVIREIDLKITKGEIFTLIGPSGSGKTTLLRIIDLLDTPSAGSYRFDGTDTQDPATDLIPLRRRMAMVFQKPAVLNTSVEENVAFGLKFRGVDSKIIGEQVRAALDMVGLYHLAKRRAISLSGGEMQRVAIARAIITKPEILLLDEPTANLDPLSSDTIESVIKKVNRESKTTVILATHDMVQGQRLADRIGVIMNGSLVQTGTGHDIFYRPDTQAIARFVGIDTILSGTVTKNMEGHAYIEVCGRTIEAVTSLPPGTKVNLYLRPEEVSLSLPKTNDHSRSSIRNHLTGRITGIVPFGPFERITVDCGCTITALLTRFSCEDLHLLPGMDVVAEIKASAVHVTAYKP